MGGSWADAVAVELNTSMQTFTSTFTPTQDLKGVEWCFHYAKGGSITNSGENSKDGDEIWFDNMSITSTDTSCDWDPDNDFGAMRRDNSGLKDSSGKLINYISVNQVGYYSNLSKIATLGDNKGDIMHGASSIDLATSPYTFELKDASSGSTVYTGSTVSKGKDADSGDNVHIIDFTEFTTPGRYYLQIQGQDWRSFEFNIGDNIYSDDSHNMLTNALNYFYQNRSGIDIESQYITSGDKTTLAHEGGHKTDTAAVQKEWVHTYTSIDEAKGTYKSSDITATGGWYDAGDHGKYVVNGGISVWTLQNMYERAVVQGNGDKFADGSKTVVVPETGNNVPDILDECAVELDWMMDMVVKSNEPTWGKYAGLVYHKLHDHKWTGLATRPNNYEEEWGTTRIVKPPTYTATMNFVACAAQAARLWEPYDSAKAAKYLEAAKSSYEAYKTHWKEYSSSEASNKQSLYPPLDQAIGGGAYGDTDSKDDAYWAACELYATTGDKAYYDDLAAYDKSFQVLSNLVGGENKGSFGSFNWGNTSSCGSLSLYLNQDKLTGLTDANKKSITDSMLAAADLYMAKEAEQGYGIPYEGAEYSDPVNLPADLVIKGYEWGSNSFVINNAMIMAYAYDETNDGKYVNGVATAMDYLFGRNPLSVSFITGYGSYAVSRPHHRYWSNELDPTLPMAPDGVMSGGPNAGLQDPYVRALGFVPGNPNNASQRCYVDSIEAWSTNEVTINWNSPFAWIVSFMQDEAATAVPGNTTPATRPTTTTAPTSPSEDVTTTTTSKVDPTTPSTPDTTNPEYTGSTTDLLYGDVNLDGDVALTDVVALSKYFINNSLFPLGKGTPETVAQAMEQADVKWNKSVDTVDASILIEYLSGTYTQKLGPQ
jgi:endoglucanase